MNKRQADRMRNGRGFIAALDQSGGSTPKALAVYGIPQEQYSSEDEMFNLVHEMRTRIITSDAFSSDKILGVILFEKTMDRVVEGMPTSTYLWEEKGIVPFLKVDKGLAELEHGVQMMKPIIDLDETIERALKNKIFGTKMRSVIKHANNEGIIRIVEQQFEYGCRIISTGLVPIIEPEVDIRSVDKGDCEIILKRELIKQLNELPAEDSVILKLTLPDEDGFYDELIKHPNVMRVAALSGGYTQAESVELLGRNKGMTASFSRALVEGLTVELTEESFDQLLMKSIESIYQAAIT